MSPILIERIQTIIVDLPTIRPHKLAMHTMQQQTLVIIRVQCSDGIEGIGEATTIGGLAYGNEPGKHQAEHRQPPRPAAGGPGGRQHQRRHAAPGQGGQGQYLRQVRYRERIARCSGQASWSTGQRAARRSGTRQSGSGLTLASGNTAKDIEEAERMLDIRRHRIFKLKIGAGEVNADLNHVIAIKQALGERASVRVDVNQAWDESVALRACRVLGDNGIDLIEQPISRINRGGQVRLNQRSPAPIMADESIESVEDAFSLAADGAASIFALKIAKNGGLRAVLRTAQIAEAAGVALYGGTMLEGAIGTLASAHAFVTLNRLTWGTELFGPLLLTEEIVTRRRSTATSSWKCRAPRSWPDPG